MMPGIRRRQSKDATEKGRAGFLPTSVQKSYFMLSDAERDVLNTALGKYRPGQSEPILVGGENLLKPALRLMTNYRLMIEEIRDSQAITTYTRWVAAVQVREAEVYLIFSPRFEHIIQDLDQTSRFTLRTHNERTGKGDRFNQSFLVA